MSLRNKVGHCLITILGWSISVGPAKAQSKPDAPSQVGVLSREEVRRDIQTNLLSLLSEKEAGIASEALVMQLTNGTASPFYPVKELCGCQNNKYISVTSILKSALHLAKVPLLITRWEELRFLPFTIDSSAIILIVKPDRELTAEKIDKILAVAKRKQISLSIVIAGGKNQSPADETVKRELLRLATESSGVLLDLSVEGAPEA